MSQEFENQKKSEKTGKRRHYENKNLRNNVKEIFDTSPERDQDEVKRPTSEYRRSLCASAERQKVQRRVQDQDEGIQFPSYQKFQDKREEIDDVESSLMSL